MTICAAHCSRCRGARAAGCFAEALIEGRRADLCVTCSDTLCPSTAIDPDFARGRRAVLIPQQHQAMFEAPLPHVQRLVGIIQVMTEGFMMHDRLLRPAQVGVSSNTQ
jgi:hypothetical protein